MWKLNWIFIFKKIWLDLESESEKLVIDWPTRLTTLKPDVDNPKIVLVDLKEFNDSVDNDTVYTDTDTDNDTENLHIILVLNKSGIR